MTIAELLSYIFEGQTTFLSGQFEEWIKSSRRFRVFAEVYRDKIRKKVRNVEDDEALHSLCAELSVAWCLIKDARFNVEYEKFGVAKHRSPDFSVSFRVNTRFNLEVTRLRSIDQSSDLDLQAVLSRKLLDAILDKIGQLRSDTPNALVIFTPYALDEIYLSAALKDLRLKAESKQQEFFVGRGFQNAEEFLKQFRRLSVVFYGTGVTGFTPSVSVWSNSLASHPIQKTLLNPLLRLLISSES